MKPGQGRIGGSMLRGVGALVVLGFVSHSTLGCGLDDPKPEGVGVAVSAAKTQGLTCGAKYMNQSTESSTLSSYPCVPGPTFPGPEWVRSLTVPAGGDVVISLDNFTWYPFVTVLLDTGTGPDPSNCVTANYYSVRFSASPGESFYIVVDQDAAAQMLFDLKVDCQAPVGETACSDGFDNDADFDTDCADPDCAADPACNLPLCQPRGTLNCGDLLVSGSTSSYATDLLDTYSCPSDRVPVSPERAFMFQAQATEEVLFTVSDFSQYPMLFVLEDDGSGCNSLRCVAHNYYSVKFPAEAGKTYYLVTDGWGETPYSYHASVICSPSPTESSCGDNVDNDGDGLWDCGDPDCDTSADCQNGLCAAAETVDCTTRLRPGDSGAAGSTNSVAWYSCSSKTEKTFGGPEYTYRLGPMTTNGPTVVTVSDYSTYPMISILEDAGGVCNPANCIAQQFYSARFTARRGRTYYAVVEAWDAPSVSYDLSVVCGAPSAETGLCGDGIDNDGDLVIDCADSDCTAACGCSAAGTLSSSSRLVPGSTSAGSSAIGSYGCYPSLSAPGNEYIYTYTATTTGPVSFTLSDMTWYGLLAVMDGSCNPGACIAEQFYSVVANVTAGRTYYIAVDTYDPVSFDYKISVVPNPPASETGLCSDNVDNDADYQIDALDPDCS